MLVLLHPSDKDARFQIITRNMKSAVYLMLTITNAHNYLVFLQCCIFTFWFSFLPSLSKGVQSQGRYCSCTAATSIAACAIDGNSHSEPSKKCWPVWSTPHPHLELEWSKCPSSHFLDFCIFASPTFCNW